MKSIELFLKELLSSPGISGYENPVCTLIQKQWEALADEIQISRVGSLHALRRASTPGEHPCVMIAAHMDAIGLMVKEIRDGLLWITQIGGVDPRVLPGQLVTVHGQKDYKGVVQMLPDRLVKDQPAGSAPVYPRLFVDTGLSTAEISKNISVGDVVSFATTPTTHGGKFISGHSLDNRASVAALTVCLEELRNYQLQWDLWAVATVQEERGAVGAFSSTFDLKPQVGIAVDVTFAQEPGLNTHETFPLGKGVTIGVGGNIHPALQQRFMEIAEEIDLPHSIETMPRSSGTDAMAIQITAAGVPTMVVGIPIRYMHTPLEMAALSDITRAGRLLARFITRLEPGSPDSLFNGGAA
ncbi:MAG TPA: M20/M25/M40 family metallo-hydrolase [Anaerolineaceae bacterium]|nr:M20/M25/M40 family metallo-hydrolase [Anaerolineaceae bacterium]